MQTEKAKALNEFLKNANQIFWKVYNKEITNDVDINSAKEYFTSANFELFRAEFESEMDENIIEYHDFKLIYDYLYGCFCERTGFERDLNQSIINNNWEVSFLIRLKKSIENQVNAISYWCKTSLYGDAEILYAHCNEVIDSANKKLNAKGVNDIEESLTPKKDERFVFTKLKEELKAIPTLSEKIKLMTVRKFELQQWQIENDIKINKGLLGDYYYKYTDKYFPNFLSLCKIEMEMLNQMLDLERKMPIAAPQQYKTPVQKIVPEHESLEWAGSDTDLLELLTALHHAEAIKRKDGKPLKRKELIEYFQQLFGIDIKRAEVKLTRATGRNDKTPFLDKLRLAFENYGVEKDRKLEMRR